MRGGGKGREQMYNGRGKVKKKVEKGIGEAFFFHGGFFSSFFRRFFYILCVFSPLLFVFR